MSNNGGSKQNGEDVACHDSSPDEESTSSMSSITDSNPGSGPLASIESVTVYDASLMSQVGVLPPTGHLAGPSVAGQGASGEAPRFQLIPIPVRGTGNLTARTITMSWTGTQFQQHAGPSVAQPIDNPPAEGSNQQISVDQLEEAMEQLEIQARSRPRHRRSASWFLLTKPPKKPRSR